MLTNSFPFSKTVYCRRKGSRNNGGLDRGSLAPLRRRPWIKNLVIFVGRQPVPHLVGFRHCGEGALFSLSLSIGLLVSLYQSLLALLGSTQVCLPIEGGARNIITYVCMHLCMHAFMCSYMPENMNLYKKNISNGRLLLETESRPITCKVR